VQKQTISKLFIGWIPQESKQTLCLCGTFKTTLCLIVVTKEVYNTWRNRPISIHIQWQGLSCPFLRMDGFEPLPSTWHVDKKCMVFMIHLMIYCKEGTNYYIMHAIYLKEGNKLVKMCWWISKPWEWIVNLWQRYTCFCLHVMCKAPYEPIFVNYKTFTKVQWNKKLLLSQYTAMNRNQLLNDSRMVFHIFVWWCQRHCNYTLYL